MLGIDKLNDWSTKRGEQATGIELAGELESHVGGQKVLYDYSLPIMRKRAVCPITYTMCCRIT